jgi:class 3 adenylate cyclase/tetratricopeptide (TPR) repeat protein
VSTIGEWLVSLGMAEYTERFAENGIEIDVLSELTDQDFEKLGVLLGHRRRMLKAIRELDQPPPAAPQVATAASAAPRDSAERRQLTVLFCDLVGSTALSGRLDPEDMRGIIRAYHRCCTELIERSGGVVAKFMGDGVLAYFGYPQAHEHDAERAIQVGLALVDTVPKLETAASMPLRVRVGIATGIVVVGDLIGTGAAQEQAVVGETPNLAARLQALAEPGAVVIAASTRRLTGGLFEYRDIDAVALKGFPETTPAWQVLGASNVQSRFEAQHGTALTPLVGREEELELLLRRWGQAANGEGRVVLLSGEAGIGKSRMVAELQGRLGSEPRAQLRYFCSPHHTNSVPLNLSPQQKKEKTFEVLLRQLEMLSNQRPILMMYEDIHWIDPSSRELLDLMVERVALIRVLLIATFRPEFRSPWTGQAHVTTLDLNRLGRREGMILAGRVAGNKALPDRLVAEIVDRTDGIPLFVEELTKAVLEAGDSEHQAKQAVFVAPLSTRAVPVTLHASLLARLDGLGAGAKEIAQIGAAIGREFSYELLASVARKSDAEVPVVLDRLGEAGLVFRRGTPPQAQFFFKHALVRDAAYSTLLREQRQQLHAHIASSLERQFPEIVQAQPEILAQHCTEAGMVEKAIDYWLMAGQRATQRSANVEAIAHFRKAIEALALLPQTVHRDRRELTLQLAIGPAFIATLGWSSAEAETVYRDALTLSERLGDQRNRFDSLWGLWYVNITRGPYGPAQHRVDELFSTAASLGDDGLRMQAHHAAWATQFWLGELLTTREHLREGLAIYDPAKHSRHALAYGGHDPGVCAKAVGSANLWLLGYPDQAARSAKEAVTLAEKLGHAPSLTHAIIFNSGMYDVYVRDYTSALKHSEQMIQVASEQKLAAHLAVGMIIHGWALAHRGHFDEGIGELRRGLDAYAKITNVMLPHFTAILADAFLRSGAAELGLGILGDALGLAEKGEEGFSLTGMLHLRGELLLLGHQEAEAEASFQRTFDLAVSQNAKSMELRAATSLARLWAKRDMHAHARDLLRPVYNWFTEGFDTPVLKEAKLLLDQLSA